MCVSHRSYIMGFLQVLAELPGIGIFWLVKKEGHCTYWNFLASGHCRYCSLVYCFSFCSILPPQPSSLVVVDIFFPDLLTTDYGTIDNLCAVVIAIPVLEEVIRISMSQDQSVNQHTVVAVVRICLYLKLTCTIICTSSKDAHFFMPMIACLGFSLFDAI